VFRGGQGELLPLLSKVNDKKWSKKDGHEIRSGRLHMPGGGGGGGREGGGGGGVGWGG